MLMGVISDKDVDQIQRYCKQKEASLKEKLMPPQAAAKNAAKGG